MRVSFRLWSVMRLAAGTPRVEVDLPAGARVGDAVAFFYERHPELRGHRALTRVAVGTEYAADDRPLNDGDEISLIPPVQGG